MQTEQQSQQNNHHTNVPVKSDGTKYFFLSRSAILALAAFSTITYKTNQIMNFNALRAALKLFCKRLKTSLQRLRAISHKIN